MFVRVAQVGKINRREVEENGRSKRDITFSNRSCMLEHSLSSYYRTYLTANEKLSNLHNPFWDCFQSSFWAQKVRNLSSQNFKNSRMSDSEIAEAIAKVRVHVSWIEETISVALSSSLFLSLHLCPCLLLSLSVSIYVSLSISLLFSLTLFLLGWASVDPQCLSHCARRSRQDDLRGCSSDDEWSCVELVASNNHYSSQNRYLVFSSI